MTGQIAAFGFMTTLVVGLLVASFVEYGVHRLMHIGNFMGARHAKHHRKFESQGWLGEFPDYSLPGLLIVYHRHHENGVGFPPRGQVQFPNSES